MSGEVYSYFSTPPVDLIEEARSAMVAELRDLFDVPLGQIEVWRLRAAVQAGIAAYQAKLSQVSVGISAR